MELENEKTKCIETENKENKNVDEFREFSLQQKLANTKVKTQSDMKAWKPFCLQENESRELCDIPQEELNLLLCKFFKTVKKSDGTEYEPVSLTSFQCSLQHSLNERGSNVNIIDGDNFKLSREVLSAKRCQFVLEHGKGNRPQAARELTEAEEDPREGDSDMKWTGMLVVSLRGVNFGFWSRLGCSGQNVIIFSRQGLI